MTNSQLMLAICLATLLVLLLLGFLLFMLLWQRGKNNRFIVEKQLMASKFNEQLFKSQLEIQEQTYDLISMDIHDNVGQTLSLLKVQLNIMEQKQLFDSELVSGIKTNVSKAMSDLRDIAKSLSSERVQLSSLPELTAHELQRLENTGIISVNQQVEGNEQGLPTDRKLILFRIIQESLQNIVKHSKAEIVTIRFLYLVDRLIVEINDNGIGFFNSNPEGHATGLGLKNIRNRTKIIGGEAKIESEPGKGTIITITLPYE